EGFQLPFVDWVKKVTTKPVVGVGRFTSPDTMARLIRQGVFDLIGAARPSIADPFLPAKIEQGRIDDIRECIGCNVCVSGDMTITPIRCTQNPTMGEEWRKGWHPERIPPKGSERRVLVIGAGPAGLEAARALGQRGYAVQLAEAGTELGGRVTRESRMPGLSEWARVRDWRSGQINRMANVEVFLGNRMTAQDVLETAADDVVIATGAFWRRDGFGRSNTRPIPGFGGPNVFTPDQLYAGEVPPGPVLLFDDDGFYVGSVLAEWLVARGCAVHMVTPDDAVASWTANTLEFRHIQKRLRTLGVGIHTALNLVSLDGEAARLACVYSDREQTIPCASVVTVTSRLPEDSLYQDLLAVEDRWSAAGIRSVTCIGDALAPGLIAHAVYSGHRYAREFEAVGVTEPSAGVVPFRRRIWSPAAG
ncbi:MAG TPA: FAD-dependent oxidoreductase, partial [Mycobacterium sp.]|nr:FAD-dependent oxidoreductase [Mycobacterium sp.]